MTSHLTTHVLDAASGQPAAGVGIVLAEASVPVAEGSAGAVIAGAGAGAGVAGAVIAQGETDADGRLALGPEALSPGDYTLTFLTGEYFAERGVAAFYPFVTVTFRVEAAPEGRHYHVPLLLSPFAYSTYRGS